MRIMTYRVLLVETEEGFAVGGPALPGCWTQGATREEALEYIRDAIREVLEAKFDLDVEQWREDGLRVETASVDVMAHA
jgi:predicted RNase H-like HicB family nuclease